MHTIALIIDTVGSYGRGLLSGVARFVQTHIGWQVIYEERKGIDNLPKWLVRGSCPGVLARVRDDRQLASLRRLGMPLVSLGEVSHPAAGMAEILSDHRMIGQLAAEHLIGRQLRHFGFYGSGGAAFSDLRLDGFRTYLAGHKQQAHIFLEEKWGPGLPNSTRRGDPFWEDAKLNQWLKQLPKPIGIMACNDYFGRLLLSACRRNEVHVPNEVAVIGVDNDEIICDLAVPPLTSVDPAADAVGFRAAELLDEMLHGRSIPPGTIYFPPKAVVARASTNTIAVADMVIVQALQFIRDQGGIGISTEDILDHLAKSSLLVSRSTLERRFQAQLGFAPHDEIARVRLERIERLLTSTNYPLARIADIVGMGTEQQLTAFFRRYRGMTPGTFRRTFGAGKPRNSGG
jgi:LacI family transcriptional regulator